MRYADDFIISGVSKEVLKDEVMPIINASAIPVGRYIKVKQEARLYDQNYTRYFAERKQSSRDRLHHYNVISKLGFFTEKKLVIAYSACSVFLRLLRGLSRV